MLKDATLTESVMIPSGVTLEIPNSYSASNLSEKGTAETSIGWVAWTNESKYLYLTLTIPNGVILDVNGSLNIGGVQSHPSQRYQGHTSGAYSQIINDGNININEGGVLYLYGLIKGNGKVTASINSTVYQPFIIAD